ncbi:MAG: glyoxylate/hydroxypyruvate reductase A [Balneolaceae bacterium]|nr:glyoxylate/hydroxypyruvate reductase A [Balneolaceae bacterium]
MSLLLLAPNRDMQPWKEAVLEVDPNLDVEVWPDVGPKERVQFVVSWDHPNGVLNRYPNLKAVSSLGAGADHILRDPELPKSVEICRVVSPSLVRQMQEYVLGAVLNFQRNSYTYFRRKQERIWEVLPNKDLHDIPVGIMGLGRLGRPVAEHLALNGYRVSGWSQSQKNIEGIHCYDGNRLDTFLSESRILVCHLPLTEATEGILELELFKKLQHPSYLINVGRGEHLVDEDLIYALDKGWFGGACLDVFTEEPLPGSHPFWNRENIMITPHAASITPPEEVAEQLVENYKRALSGMELLNQVDREKGY